VLPDVPDDICRYRENLLPALVDRVLPLDIRCGDKDVDHVHITVKTGIDVGFYGTGEPADLRFQSEFFDCCYRLSLGFRRCRKACLDYMDADIGELASDLKFLLESEGYSRGLFPSRSVVSKTVTLSCAELSTKKTIPRKILASHTSPVLECGLFKEIPDRKKLSQN